MNAALYNLEISRGADFDFTLRILDSFDEPVSFTGSATFKAEIREAHRKPLAATFAFETLTGAGSSTVNATLAAGDVRFILTDTQTKALDVNKKYEWDFFWTDPAGAVTKLIEGAVTVDPNITNV